VGACARRRDLLLPGYSNARDGRITRDDPVVSGYQVDQSLLRPERSDRMATVFGAQQKVSSEQVGDVARLLRRSEEHTSSYLTDGVRLYRFLGIMSAERLAEIEDCGSLQIMLVPVDELLQSALRAVIPAPAAAS
jgi:hypothetical protein